MKISSDYTTQKIKEFANELKRYDEDIEYYTWHSDLPSKLPNTINVKIFLEEKISAYQGKQISECSVLFIKDTFYSHGNEVKGTLISDITSREYERRRRLMGALRKEAGADEHPDLLPIAKAGFACSYDSVKRIEALTFGNRFSVYFFGEGEDTICRINDVTSEELEQIKEIFTPYNVDWKLEEFNLPMRDICLFLALGFVLLIMGWFLVVIIFP